MITAKVGDYVQWDITMRGRQRGVVVEVGTPEDSAYADELMGRVVGTGLGMFGLLLRVRCTDADCQCNRTDWKHAVNESQLEQVEAADWEVALW
jgi:hypothetical protein